ncbi:MAG: penicillin-binding transpeptidase domain-containing protein [Anaerovoracaceae bacterium]
MGSKIKNRQIVIIVAFVILMCLLAGRLFYLTVIQHKTWSEAATNLSTKTVYTSAARGEIYDRYGRLVAGNKQEFAVNMVAAETDESTLNDVALKLINLLEKNGDTITDNFPIIINDDGSFTYTYDNEIKQWLESQDMSTDLTAEEAFNELRDREGIDESLSAYEAQEELQNTYSIYPPISVKTMKYTAQLELENFLEGFGLDTDLSAEDAFNELRDKYDIDSSLSDEDARKILIVRNALKNLGYQSYMPAEIASSASQETVIELEENSEDYPGAEVERKSVRYYPNGSTACHVIGYLGSISESEQDEYIEKGYSSTDLVGKEGIESYYEDVLKGKAGSKTIEVNAEGQQVDVISETDLEPGKDVTLTIDLNLQKVAEESLEKAIKGISTGGTFQSKYGNFSYSKAYSNCNAGAAVAVDVKTGQVLALASYPGYDPNLFAEGISSEDWESLQSENPRDPLSARPLYNIATMTSVQPGSTFKPITCLSALNAGFSPNTYLSCAGYVKLGSRTFGCWIWNEYHGSHGGLNMRSALEVSCNYYMYDLGAGRNFAAGGKLSVDHDISDVMEYAKKLGLDEKTGLEISESVAGVPSEESKNESIKSQLSYYLKTNASKLFNSDIADDKNTLSDTIDTIVAWVDSDTSTMTRSVVKSQLEDLGVKDDELDDLTDKIRADYIGQGKWTTGDKLNLSIGQGENAYTPAQMARYIACVANGGTLYDLTLTKEVEGEGARENNGVTVENSNSSAWEVIQDGMHLVAQGSSGTARRIFAGFPYNVGAKTGTAQKSGKINTTDEVEYIKEHLSGIAPGLTFDEVETEMKRLMKEDPETYSSEAIAVRRAVMNLADVTSDDIDKYKESYSNFSWFVAFGPTEDPQIAVAVLLFQGGAGAYAGPVAREIIGQYLDLQSQYESGNYDLVDVESSSSSSSSSSTTSVGNDPDV